MTEKCCKDCVHFIQHYRKQQEDFVWINCGHCIALRGKFRRAFAKICEHFQQTPSV